MVESRKLLLNSDFYTFLLLDDYWKVYVERAGRRAEISVCTSITALAGILHFHAWLHMQSTLFLSFILFKDMQHAIDFTLFIF